MKKYILKAVILIETVVITVLATVLFMPKEKPKLSEMSWEEKIAFLDENGIEYGSLEKFAVNVISECEKNPYYAGPVMDYTGYYTITDGVRQAVNKYYGRDIGE